MRDFSKIDFKEVLVVPNSKARAYYVIDDMLARFLESGQRSAVVTGVDSRDISALANLIRTKARKHSLPLTASKAQGECYIVRIDK